MSKKYIGVDLGAWLSKKTSIAIIVNNKDKIILEEIRYEPLGKAYNYSERDDALVELLKKLANNNALIGIDAPFSIPSALKKTIEEEFYELTKEPSKKYNQINNPYLFDNSARFVLDTVDEVVLAPCATLIGAYTARIAHIFSNEKYLSILNPVTNSNFEEKDYSIKSIEVYPRATLKILLNRNKIPTYKKSSKNFKDKKEEMLCYIKPYLENTLTELDNIINSDDDYDAVICALTVYLIDKNGFEKPMLKNNEKEVDEEALKKFRNSFIYMPKIEEVKNCHD